MIETEARPRIDTAISVNPYLDEQGRKALFVARSDTSKLEWARKSGLETINGGLDKATSGAENYLDELLHTRGMEAYNYQGLGIPYHLHVARYKAAGGLKWYDDTRDQAYYGKRFAVGDVTVRIRDNSGDDILNKPESPQNIAEIATRLYRGIQEGAEVSYDAGVAVGILGMSEDIRLCTVHSQIGTLRRDLPMDRLLALIAHEDFAGCTGGLDIMQILQRDFIAPPERITTSVTEWDNISTAPIGSLLPEYAALEEDPTRPAIHLINAATPVRYSSFEVAPDLAVNQLTLGCIARGFVPLW